MIFKENKLEQATKQQLETIALHENCSVDFKFQVCRELQQRKKQKPMNLYWKSIFYICFRWW